MITGKAKRDGIVVEVAPGGALRSLQLSPEALQLGASRLAKTIRVLVRVAARKANEEARRFLEQQFNGLTEEEFTVLGVGSEPASSSGGSGR